MWEAMFNWANNFFWRIFVLLASKLTVTKAHHGNCWTASEFKQLNGEWVKPILCSRRVRNVTNSDGSWKEKSWTDIADMYEFAFFQMTFPKNFFWEILIPQTNTTLKGEDLSLLEFYVWLGINLLMGCYGVIYDWCDWWLSNPIYKFWKQLFAIQMDVVQVIQCSQCFNEVHGWWQSWFWGQVSWGEKNDQLI